jgi:DHA1 family bicyclomycin/chloramphenicol resistance-like MFS transporter
MHEGVAAARFFSRLLLISGLAPILAPILGGQLLRFTDWRGVFVFLALVGVVLLAGARVLLPETLPHQRRQVGGISQTFSIFDTLLHDRIFIGYALTMGFTGAALFGYIASSPFVLQTIFELSQQQFSIIFGTIAIGFIASSQINARLVGRRSLRQLLGASLLAFASCGFALLVLVLLDVGLIGVLIPLYAMMWTMGFIFPNAIALALTNYAHAAGSASAFMGLAQFASGAIAAPLVGIAGESTAVPMAVIIAFSALAALGSFAGLTRQRKASTMES